MKYIGNGMRPGVSLGVLGYPGVSWGKQTDPNVTGFFNGGQDRFSLKKRNLRPSSG